MQRPPATTTMKHTRPLLLLAAFAAVLLACSFDLTVQNHHASTAEGGAIIINLAVIKAVSS